MYSKIAEHRRVDPLSQRHACKAQYSIADHNECVRITQCASRHRLFVSAGGPEILVCVSAGDRKSSIVSRPGTG